MIKLTFENEVVNGDTSAKITVPGGMGGKPIKIESDKKYLWLCLEGIKEKAIVYAPKGLYEFVVPEGEVTHAFEPGRFDSEFTLSCEIATDEDIYSRRNLALNPLDMQFESEVNPYDAENYVNPVDSAAIKNDEVLGFPHIYGNRITRHEGWFYARNVIDGMNTKGGHGDYPYHSWGTSQCKDANIIIYFGRKVKIDTVYLALRSDYELIREGLEHDTYWVSGTLEFSDGTEEIIHPIKSGDYQEFKIAERVVEWVRLKDLVPACTENFASLNQIKIMGQDIK